MSKMSNVDDKPSALANSKIHAVQPIANKHQYICSVHGCVFMCTTSHLLLRHKRKAHLPHLNCDMCSYSSSESYNLKRHKKTKHSAGLLECDMCSGDSYNLKRHKKSKHPNDDLEGSNNPYELCNPKDDLEVSNNLYESFNPYNLRNFKDNLETSFNPYELCNYTDYSWLDLY